MKPSLREMLDEYNQKRWGHIHEYFEGFEDAINIMMPCLEALEKASTYRFPDKVVKGEDFAEHALNEKMAALNTARAEALKEKS
jgi:hypothetical protein